MTEQVQFGALTPHYPPMEGIAEAAIDIEAQGLDFVCFGDQLQGTEPRTIMTEDIVPGPARFTKQQWTDAFIQCTMAAMTTGSVELSVFTDGTRAQPRHPGPDRDHP